MKICQIFHIHTLFLYIYIYILIVLRQIDGLAPTFSKKPAIRQEDDGKRLLFECRIQADPRPVVNWFHNGNPVTDSARHKVGIPRLLTR